MKTLNLRNLLISSFAAALAFGVGVNQASATSSDVSTDGGAANTIVSTIAAPAAAANTATVVSSAIGSAIGGAVGGSVAPAPVAPAPTVAPSTSLYDRYQGGIAQGDSNVAQKLKSIPAFNTRNIAGASAQGRAPATGVWLQGAYTYVDNSETGGQFDGDVFNILVGIDHKPARFNNRLVVGVAAGYETMSIDTKFNAGTFDGDGFTVAPYIGYIVTPNVAVDLALGAAILDYDNKRTTGGTVTGSFDAKRYFAAGNVTGNFQAYNGKVRLSPKAGLLALLEDQDSYTDSVGTAVPSTKIHLGRAMFGLEAGYNAGNGIEPFVGVTGNWDFNRNSPVTLVGGKTASDDEFSATFRAGLNIRRGNISGMLAGETNQLKNDIETYSVMGRIRLDF
jgi:outer membrane autotransporter protein